MILLQPERPGCLPLLDQLLGTRRFRPAPAGVIPSGAPRQPRVSVTLPAYKRWLRCLNCLRLPLCL